MESTIFIVVLMVILFFSGIIASAISQSILPLIIAILADVVLIFRFVMKKMDRKDDLSQKVKNQNLKYDSIFLIFSIVSILTSTIWHISLVFGLSSLIYSIMRIKESGYAISKATTSLSIIGITLCMFIYISAIMIIIVGY